MGTVKIFRNPEAMWREEDASKENALKGLEKGEDVSGIGTSIILFHGQMHSLNMLGTEIWRLCDGKTFDEIVSTLQENFDVEKEVLERDIDSFLSNLKGLGLVYEE